MAQFVRFKKVGFQTAKRTVLPVKRAFFQIIRQIDQHFSLRVFVAAKAMQPREISKEKVRQFQLPRGEKAGVGSYILPNTGVNFVIELGKQEPVLRRFCDFFNSAAFHSITFPYYSTETPFVKEVFLVPVD